MTTAEAKEAYEELSKDCPIHESNLYVQLLWAIFRLLLEGGPPPRGKEVIPFDQKTTKK